MADQNINNMTVIWNSGGTTFSAIKINVTDTASAAASLLLNLQVGGNNKFNVDKNGSIASAANLSIAGNGTITGNLTVNGTLTAAGIVGTVTGPASSTDNAIVRWNGAGGSATQNSGVIIDDSNNITGAGAATFSGTITTAGLIGVGTQIAVGPASAGNIVLRPNGVASATGQLVVASTGAVTINGTLTVTG